MTDSAIIALAAALSIAVSTMFPALGQGKTALHAAFAGFVAQKLIARQPDAAGDIRSSLIISMAMMEALTIYGLLIAFMLVAKV